ncbi:hypothetical protein [Micromonospora sp. RTGN7]|uniref:hypothetical protein n=1 Tax=Micromonospora sp. RTGN7 TaxID=3016526 RepID=UPI0029FECC37|nr:hypothetical protein [Micromonospora sp. RTGN7]
MTILAGDDLSAARLNRLQPVVYSTATSASLALTATQTDLPGGGITFNTTAAGAVWVAWAAYDFNQLAATTNDCFGRLVVDGATQTALAAFGGVAVSERGSVSQTWTGTLAAAGSHTIKLAGRATAASQYEVLPATTTLVLMILEVA